MCGLFAGALPSVLWICLGGGIFFGVYDHVRFDMLRRWHEQDGEIDDDVDGGGKDTRSL